MLILVTGLTGAGKTTYCQSFIKEHKAKYFSIDNWMKSLYWQDMPEEPDIDWFVENQKWYTDRMKRCEFLIRKEAQALLEIGVTVLLDLGFTSRESRGEYIQFARNLKKDVEIHFLDVDKEIRWQRVEKRNQGTSESYAMQVSRDMFDYIESVFEPFSDEEKEILNKV